MEPTLYPENLVIVNKIAYRKKKPQKNDIALIRIDFDTIPVIHRIIACPNDTIIIRDGVVQVNGEIIKFNALDTVKPETIVLPKDTYYHKGDNPNSYFDVISSRQILGKAIYISGGKSQPD
jgi:signal peptidase I